MEQFLRSIRLGRSLGRATVFSNAIREGGRGEVMRLGCDALGTVIDTVSLGDGGGGGGAPTTSHGAPGGEGGGEGRERGWG